MVEALSGGGRRFLVTGGGGFIGSNLTHQLVEAGHQVRVFDSFATGRRENLAGLEGRFDLIEGDLRDADAVRRAVDGMEFVLHQAALPSVPRSVAAPIESNDVNVNGTLNVLVAARDAGVKRVVYAASSSAYGDTDVLPKVETLPTKPLSPYAVAKLAGEHYCAAFSRVYGLETVALRYFNVFGPRQDPASQYSAVIPLFISAIQAGRPLMIHGDGEQSRDFTYIDNVVQANLRACVAGTEAVGEAMNVGVGSRITLNQLAAELGRIMGRMPEIIYTERRAGDVRDSQASIEKAQRLIGYEPTVSLAEGLARTVAFFQTVAAVEGSAALHVTGEDRG